MDMARKKRQTGVSLVEYMVVAAVISVTAAMAVPVFDNYARKSQIERAVNDIGMISLAVDRYRLNRNGQIPASLSELGIEIPLDPWDRPYQFANIPSSSPTLETLRKDRTMVPLNADYDLYSSGRDGLSPSSLSAKASADDILRAGNGSYIGLANKY